MTTNSRFDALTRGFATAAADIRNKVVEEPWYGHATTTGDPPGLGAAAEPAAEPAAAEAAFETGDENNPSRFAALAERYAAYMPARESAQDLDIDR